jgi:hypothetical protein
MELFSHMTTSFVTLAKLQLPHYSDIHAYAILVHTRHNNSLQEHIQLNDTQNLIFKLLETNNHQVIIHL